MKGTIIMKKLLKGASIGKYTNCLRSLSKHPSRPGSLYTKSSKIQPKYSKNARDKTRKRDSQNVTEKSWVKQTESKGEKEEIPAQETAYTLPKKP